MLALNGKFHITDINCGDKSVTHRALILSAIADGNSVITNASVCRDVLSTASCLRKLGAEITRRGTVFHVSPIKTPKDNVTLNCGNSGTTARLLCGLVSGLGITATFTGDKSLKSRPMGRVIEPLRKMGANITTEKNILFKVHPSKLVSSVIDTAVTSAQVKSALLLASLFTEKSTVTERVETRHHTENILRFLGADLSVDGHAVTVGRNRLKGGVIDVPNDISSVIYPIALALCTGRQAEFKNVGIDSCRTGAIDVLRKAGADIRFENVETVCGERRCTIVVNPSRLQTMYCTVQNTADAIDEIPLLAVVASTICGRHVFENVGELALKESNRIEGTIGIVRSMGQSAYVSDGNLIVESDGKIAHTTETHSNGDHRIAMCGTVAALIAGCGSVFGYRCVDVSCPDFYNMLGIHPMKFALIGNGISNSKSPLLMSLLACHHGVCCTYDKVELPQDVTDEKLADILQSYDGLNVTMPFKQRVARILKSDLSAVNTVCKGVATSTDGYGILKSLQLHGIDVKGKKLLVIGCGGAGITAVETLLSAGATVYVINRTESKACQVRQKYGLNKTYDRVDGILSFVPPCKFSADVDVSGADFVFTAEYKTHDCLLDKAEQIAIQAIDGLEMLYFQGCKSFEIWTGKHTDESCLKSFGSKI